MCVFYKCVVLTATLLFAYFYLTSCGMNVRYANKESAKLPLVSDRTNEPSLQSNH